VYLLEAEMPQEEFQNWLSFFERRPLGWREDSRTFKLMSSFGFSGKAEQAFESLRVINADLERTSRPTDSLKGSFLFHKMVSAKGGDTLELS
jgi:hypothetical protein